MKIRLQAFIFIALLSWMLPSCKSSLNDANSNTSNGRIVYFTIPNGDSTAFLNFAGDDGKLINSIKLPPIKPDTSHWDFPFNIYSLDKSVFDIGPYLYDIKTFSRMNKPSILFPACSSFVSCLSPDNSQIAYATCDDNGGSGYNIVVQNIQNGDYKKFPFNMEWSTRIYWLPNSKNLLVWGAMRNGNDFSYPLQIVDPHNGQILFSYDAPSFPNTSFINGYVYPDPTSDRIIGVGITGDFYTFYLLDRNNLSASSFTTSFSTKDYYFLHQVIWSPDGKQILFKAHHAGDSQDLYSVNTGGGNLKLLQQNIYGGYDWSPDSKQIVYSNDELDNNGKNRTNIYLINPDGSGKRLIISDADLGAWISF